MSSYISGPIFNTLTLIRPLEHHRLQRETCLHAPQSRFLNPSPETTLRTHPTPGTRGGFLSRNVICVQPRAGCALASQLSLPRLPRALSVQFYLMS